MTSRMAMPHSTVRYAAIAFSCSSKSSKTDPVCGSVRSSPIRAGGDELLPGSSSPDTKSLLAEIICDGGVFILCHASRWWSRPLSDGDQLLDTVMKHDAVQRFQCSGQIFGNKAPVANSRVESRPLSTSVLALGISVRTSANGRPQIWCAGSQKCREMAHWNLSKLRNSHVRQSRR